MTDKEKIIVAFRAVKALGKVKSNRSHNTGIGKTLEDYIGVDENNLKEPDLNGFEIKSHRGDSTSYVTLFTKSPSFPKRGANAKLKDKYGECYPDSQLKKLHTSIFADRHNSYMGRISFRLIHKPDERRIYIGVYSVDTVTLLDDTVFYTYDDIQSALTKKLKNLLYVKADNFKEKDGEYFLFKSADIYMNLSFEKFLAMLDDGEIMYDIRIGSYKCGNKKGKPHDHGSGFRIREKDIKKLYSYHEFIE